LCFALPCFAVLSFACAAACATAYAAFLVCRTKLQTSKPPLDYQMLIWVQKMVELLLRVLADWLVAGCCLLLAAAA